VHAFVFGLGYVGAAYAKALAGQGWTVAATARTPEQRANLEAQGFTAVDPADPAAMAEALRHAKAVLATPAPTAEGCPALPRVAPAIARAGAFPDWIGYLSTTGVYGDRQGGWVDERSALSAQSVEGARRVSAERDWREVAGGMGLTVASFRLPGIYGPGRSAFDRLREGGAKRVDKPGQVFSRAHRDDIVSALLASMARPRPAAAYNICDDEPASAADVTAYAADLLGLPAPPLTTEITEGGRRFYAENKRVSNALAKAELGWRPHYPTYREGLQAILAAEQN